MPDEHVRRRHTGALQQGMEFVGELKSGRSPLSAPIYSHLHYDLVPGLEQTVVAA